MVGLLCVVLVSVVVFWFCIVVLFVASKDLKRYYRCAFICDCCYASSKLEWLNSGDFAPSAQWRSTISMFSEADQSPWSIVHGYHKERCLWDGVLTNLRSV